MGLVAGLLIAASLTYSLAGPSANRTVTATSMATTTATSTSVTTTTATTTSVSVTTQDITTTTTYGGPLTSYSSVETVTGFSPGKVFYRTGNGWNFSVTLSSLGVTSGKTIYVYVNLTNISGHTQKVNEMNPLINPVLYCEGGPCGNVGAQVWAWSPSGATNFTRNFDYGQWEFSGPYPIPTGGLAGNGGAYTLSIWPLIGPSGQSLMVNATIGQSLMINTTISVS